MRESRMTISILFHNQYGTHVPQQGWTKWGGARSGMLKEDLEIWYCQVCAREQIRILPSYMFTVDETGRDFVRICSLCKAKSILRHISRLEELLDLVR